MKSPSRLRRNQDESKSLLENLCWGHLRSEKSFDLNRVWNKAHYSEATEADSLFNSEKNKMLLKDYSWNKI